MQQKGQRHLRVFLTRLTAGIGLIAGLAGVGVAGPLNQSNFRIQYVDSQETIREYHPADHAIDGNPRTWWFSEWTGGVKRFPHEIQIDLGDLYDVDGFRYLPRQDRSHGRVKDYKIFVSMDGKSWGNPVAAGRFPNTRREQEVRFAKKSGRYVRFLALSEVEGNSFASAAELNVLGTAFGGNIQSGSGVQSTAASAPSSSSTDSTSKAENSSATPSSRPSSDSTTSGNSNAYRVKPVNWRQLVSDATGRVYRVSSAAEFNDRAKNARPGDVILVRSGRYRGWDMTIRSNGNRDNPIVYAAESPGNVTFTGGTRLKVYGNYNIIGGFRFEGVDQFEAVSFKSADYNRFTDNVFKNAGAGRYIRVLGISDGSDNNLIDHNEMIRTNGIGMAIALPRDGRGGTYSRYNRFISNIFRDVNVGGTPKTGYQSLQIGAYANQHENGDSFTMVAHNQFINIRAINVINSKGNSEYYHNNIFRNVSEVALGLRSGNDKVVDGNEFYNVDTAIRVIGTGIEVVNNIIVDTDFGIQIPAWGDYQTGSGLISPSGPTGNILVAHNTIVNSDNNGLELGRVWGFVNRPGYRIADNPPFDVRVINNIFSSDAGLLLRKRTAINATIRRNLFYARNSADAGHTGTEAVTGNPNLDRSYKPSTSSIAVDRGVTLSEVDEDIRDRSRRGKTDLGAYEVR